MFALTLAHLVMCFCSTIFLKRDVYIEILCVYHHRSRHYLTVSKRHAVFLLGVSPSYNFIHFNTRHESIERQHVHVAVNDMRVLSYYQVIKNPVTDHLPTGCKKIGRSLVPFFSLSNITVFIIIVHGTF